VKPEETAKTEENMKTIPVRFPQETKKRKKTDTLYTALKDEKYSIQSSNSYPLRCRGY
jgi:hypothetical protein